MANLNDKFSDLVTPLVNSNGTNPKLLIDRYNNVYIDLDIAYGRLKLTGPNARDYADTAAFDLATEQHKLRLRKVADLMDELAWLIEQIDQQNK